MMQWSARLKAAWIRRVLRRRQIPFRDRYGLQYCLEQSDDLALYFRHRGWFEQAEQEFVRQYLRPGMITFDVGAYIGIYACLMAKLVGPDGQVHAFEPSRRTFQRLLDNIRVNNFTNVSANNQAVFSQPGTSPLQLYESPFESLSSLVHAELVRSGRTLHPVSVEPVETVSLDQYCEKHRVSRIDLLKLDAEGAELEVLRGARGLLTRRAIRGLLVEVGAEIAQVLDCLRGQGFQLFALSRVGSLETLAEADITHRPNLVALCEGQIPGCAKK
jgi:FkbM family methyltransferase